MDNNRYLVNRIKEKVMHVLFFLCAMASIASVVIICIFIFANGLPAIGEIGIFEFLGGRQWRPSHDKYGIFSMIVGSIYVTAGAIIIGVPIGLLCAVFMAKFCPKWLYKIIKPLIELMAGIPSIVYGFFGIVVIVPEIRAIFGGSGKGILTASILLGIMILPTLVSVIETSLRAVPNSYYEGALALGATHERSVFFTTLPAAKSGIMAGIILGIGRAIGETMAVVMVAGNQAIMPEKITSGIRTLTANIVLEMGYATDLHEDALIATAAVLFVFILIINTSFSLLNREKKDKVIKKRVSGRYFISSLARILVYMAASIVATVVLFLLGYIFVNGIPHLSTRLFEWGYSTENNSMLPAIINTFLMMLLTLLIAVPIGVFSAIYMVEYAKRGNKLVAIIRLTTETLSGIPSIVYGLFGYLAFVIAFGWSYSMMAGALTLAIMVLPLIMRTTQEALLSVPDSFREGSFGLGAGKRRTVFRVILPSAIPGILSGVLLAAGRIMGETAALIFTAGTVAKVPGDVFSSARTLAVHMYCLLNEGLYIDDAYATAVILVVFVLGMNGLSKLIASKFGKTNA